MKSYNHLVCFVFIFCFNFCWGCLRMTSSDGSVDVPATTTTTTMTTTMTTTTTTTTTAAPLGCGISTTEPSIFLDDGITLTDTGYGKIPPTRSCNTCPGGKTYFYTSTMSNTINKNEGDAMGTVSGATCKNICICDNIGNCYVAYSATNIMLLLWQYCNAGTCGVYVVLDGTQSTDQLINPTTYTTITLPQQSYNGMRFPVPNGNYVNAATIGCNTCFPSACQTTNTPGPYPVTPKI